MYINYKFYYSLKIIIIVLLFFYVYKYINNENFDNIEAINNIKSVFNKDKLIINNISINGEFNMIPKGSVVAWTQTTIPKGWIICDGKNGTPDLRGRFIIGTGQGSNLTNRNLGDIGGEENHLLSPDEIPQHAHQTIIFSSQGFLQSIDLDGPGCGAMVTDFNGPYLQTGNPQKGANQVKATQAHNNMPPFYILYYIMKL